MAKKGTSFSSFAELSAIKLALKSKTPAPAAEKPISRGGDFQEVEREMLAKGAASLPPLAKTLHREPPQPATDATLGGKMKKFERRQRKAKQAPPPSDLPPGVRRRGKQLIVKVPGARAIMRKIREREQGLESQSNSGPSEVEQKHMLGSADAAFKRIVELVGQSTPRVETPPTQVRSKITETVAGRICLGSNWFAEHSAPAEPGFIVGFDFGTSSAKIVVRDPDGREDDVAALAAPNELQSTDHPYLWQTTVWYHPDSQQFSLTPRLGYRPLTGFKTGLISGQHGGRVVADLPVTRVQAAIAFIALHAAHLFGWCCSEEPLGYATEAYLRFNIGVPVAAIDNTRTCDEFKRIVRAAFALIPDAPNLTRDAVCAAYQAAPAATPEGFDIVPELAAAIAGYSSQNTARPGAHLLVDVGASTLDLVTFLRVESRKATGIESSVELLGAAALKTASAMGVDEDEFNLACRKQFSDTLVTTRSPARSPREFEAGKQVQVLATGGGRYTTLHKEFIERMATSKLLGEVPIIHPEPPKAMVTCECDLSRLLLAYGLTMDIFEKVELLPPSQTPDIPVRERFEIMAPGPEQC